MKPPTSLKSPTSKVDWLKGPELFLELSKEYQSGLVALKEALQKVRPLNLAHQRSLVSDILDLSALLTTKRAELSFPYWSNPGFISAYLYYFLPWNLVRLGRLLAGFNLSSLEPRVFLDLGSGPLTFPLAVWLAYPELRAKPLTFVVQDKAKQPLEWGFKLFKTLSEIVDGPLTWQIKFCPKPLNFLADFWRKQSLEPPRLVSAINLLNEVCQTKSTHSHGVRVEEEGEEGGGKITQGLEQLGANLAWVWPKGGEKKAWLLAVEPGTRLGGKIIMSLRDIAQGWGLKALLPCTHSHKCPLSSKFGQRTWCHFTFKTEGVPAWLEKLSASAGLQKETLSLAPLLLGRENLEVVEKGLELICVLSHPLKIPGLKGQARYACSQRGLLLLENAANLTQGMRLKIPMQAKLRRDPKSGALIVSLPS